jgi:hypothetical protein
MNIPIVQDDQASGTVFGLLARVKAFSFIVLEPNVAFGKWGEPGEVDGYDLGIDGSKVTSFGIDATVGGVPGVPGFKPYGLIGIGIYSVKNDDTDYDESKLGFSAGLGFGIGITPMVDLDLRGKFIIAPQEEGSKKAVYATAGLTYNFNLGY